MNKDLTSLDKLLITGTILSTPLISSMFWHVHPSFLIITLPFFSLLFFNLGLQATFLQNRKIITLSIISGMLILFYQLFVVIIPMFFLGFVLGNLKSRNKIDLLRPIIFSLTFFIPLIFWFLFNYFNSTNIFYESSKYSQFSWILNIENLYDLKNQVQSFVNQIDNAFRYHWLVPFFLIIIMLFKNKLEFSNLRNIIPLGSIFFIVIYTIIIFLMGYYLDRFLSAIVITLNITAI